MRTTATAARAKKEQQAADFEEMLAESKKAATNVSKGPRAKTLSQAGRPRKKIVHRKELDQQTLDKLVTLIRDTYPEKRFNMAGSKEGVLAHYISQMEQSKGWPSLVTTSGCKFWLNPDGELVISDDNWYK